MIILISSNTFAEIEPISTDIRPTSIVLKENFADCYKQNDPLKLICHDSISFRDNNNEYKRFSKKNFDMNLERMQDRITQAKRAQRYLDNKGIQKKIVIDLLVQRYSALKDLLFLELREIDK